MGIVVAAIAERFVARRPASAQRPSASGTSFAIGGLKGNRSLQEQRSPLGHLDVHRLGCRSAGSFPRKLVCLNRSLVYEAIIVTAITKRLIVRPSAATQGNSCVMDQDLSIAVYDVHIAMHQQGTIGEDRDACLRRCCLRVLSVAGEVERARWALADGFFNGVGLSLIGSNPRAPVGVKHIGKMINARRCMNAPFLIPRDGHFLLFS